MSALIGVPYTMTPLFHDWFSQQRPWKETGSYLVETVEKGIVGRHRAEAAARDPALTDLGVQAGRRDVEQFAKACELLRGGLGLARWSPDGSVAERRTDGERKGRNRPVRRRARRPKPRRGRWLRRLRRRSALRGAKGGHKNERCGDQAIDLFTFLRLCLEEPDADWREIGERLAGRVDLL